MTRLLYFGFLMRFRTDSAAVLSCGVDASRGLLVVFWHYGEKNHMRFEGINVDNRLDK